MNRYMSDIVIRIESLSKQDHLSVVGAGMSGTCYNFNRWLDLGLCIEILTYTSLRILLLVNVLSIHSLEIKSASEGA